MPLAIAIKLLLPTPNASDGSKGYARQTGSKGYPTLPGILFYPPQGGSSTEAITICRACLVRTECLIHCLVHGEMYGIWGRTTEAERRDIRRAVTRCP